MGQMKELLRRPDRKDGLLVASGMSDAVQPSTSSTGPSVSSHSSSSTGISPLPTCECKTIEIHF